MDFHVAINSYVDTAADRPQVGRVFDGVIFVHALPSRVELRSAWLIHDPADMPGYIPFARLTLAHSEPDERNQESVEPTMYHDSLERFDGSSVLFLAYAVAFKSKGTHRIGFPRTNVPDFAVTVTTAG